MAITSGVVCDRIESTKEVYQVDSCVLYTSKEDTIYKFFLVGQDGRQLKLYIPEDKVDYYYDGEVFKISKREIILLT